MKFLLITPPLTQLNTPYPATTVLKGYLQSVGFKVDQTDLGIELVDKIFTKSFLSKIFKSENAYTQCVEYVIKFLRGQDPTLASRIVNRSLLPEGKRFKNLADMEWAFGVSSFADKAQYLATQFIEDIADYIRENIDNHFDLIRYAEHLANFAPNFDVLQNALNQPLTIIDELMLNILKSHIDLSKPDIVGFSIPFPGCLYGALRCGQFIKNNFKNIKIILGGGFPNTEWRQISDTRIFNYCDFITLDDGEIPLKNIADFLDNKISINNLVRTFYLENSKIKYSGNDLENNDFSNQASPDFDGLPLNLYFSLAEMTNPMHRLWTNGRWNKMMVAHGCYWAKCAFCDTNLDYIQRFCMPSAKTVVDRMQDIINQTNITGFHFVDEALPPKLLKEICQEILSRKMIVSFWGNIRFEKSYNKELTDLMADAGCIAVSGGLEVASNRLLKLMNKGVTIEQTIQACRNFRNSGIMVHTYLMYGFPTETLQETINALEIVRRMFDEGIVQSAFWHRYAMTAHSNSGKNPENFGAKRLSFVPNSFCNNEVEFENNFDYNIEAVGRGLDFATYNFMNDIGLDLPLKRWFDIKIPKPNI
ncbi:MAG: radical SAM protein [Bacteroidales bacterium]|nr:radical SAM protein [Bacteroidales bacterium]